MICIKPSPTKFLLLKWLMLFLLSTSFVDAKEKIDVELKLSTQQVWQREQVLLTLSLKTDDPFSRLELKSFQQKGFSIIPFEQQRLEKKDHTLLRMTWAIFPFVAGNHILELPRIRYRPNRGRIQTLELEALSLQVRRLPVYVPPTMPVGKIKLKSIWNNGWLVSNKNLLEWEVTLEGESVAKQTLPPITRQLVSTNALQFFPVQNTLKIVKSGGGVNYQQQYKVPLKALNNGLVKLPEINVQYFDPEQGKLQTAKLTVPTVIVLSTWIIWVIGLLLIVIVITLMLYLIKIIRPLLKKSAQKKAALQLLTSSSNYQDIRHSLSQLSKAYGWDENLSLSNFVILWEKQFRSSPELENAMDKLQALEFSSTETTEEKLEGELKESSGIKQLIEKLVILLR